MSPAQPFNPQRVRGLRLDDTVGELGASWHRGVLDRFDHERRRAITRDGDELPYDVLVLALGAHPEREWESEGVLTFHGSADELPSAASTAARRPGRKLAFVKPAGVSWPVPLYDLALLTAAQCAARQLSEVELSLITPEEEPLGMFGKTASAGVRRLLEESGVALHASSYGAPGHDGWLDITPGHRRIQIDRIVTQPRLVGPRLRGIPCDHDGFIRTDANGRLADLDGVFAAGDATTFPVKHGGLAAQQADAVAEAIAASVGVDIDRSPSTPSCAVCW